MLNLLVDLELSATCHLQPDLVLAQLPSKKQLWEAPDEASWEAERNRESRTETTFALAANGELVQLDPGQQCPSSSTLSYKPLDTSPAPRDAASWEEWCSGMDGFGGLVMLTASLII